MHSNLFLLSCIAAALILPARLPGQGMEKAGSGNGRTDVEVNTDVSTEVAWGYDAYRVYNLSDINSADLEYAPSITADGRTLYFVSDRPGGFGGHDIWSAVKNDPASTEFSAPLNAGKPVNTNLNEGVTSIAPDGMTIYFTLCNGPDGYGDCDIYQARLEGEEWKDIRNLGQVNSPYWDSQPSVSGSGDTLYFVSNRPGAMGGGDDVDIYMAIRNRDGSWNRGVNIGEPVNTKLREDSPFCLPGSNRLYFSSAGHGGYGRLDFFVAYRRIDGSWGNPQNLGPVFNTELDERMLYGAANDGIFYFASERTTPANRGMLDIFMAVWDPELATEMPFADTARIAVDPNPARDRISVRAPEPIPDRAPVEIFDARGILRLRFTLKEAEESVSIESLPSGFYFAKTAGYSTTFVVRR